MGFWSRLFGNEASAPEWSGMRSDSDYQAFVAIVEDDLRARGEPGRVVDGVVEAAGKVFSGQLGLGNLAQRCAKVTPDAWSSLVKKHFDVVQATMAPGGGKPAMDDFDRVRHLLRARLYANEPLLDKTFGWPIGDALFLALAVDLPTSIATVSREERAKWTIDDAALGALALANLVHEAAPKETQLPVGDGVILRVVEGESFFTATRAVALFESDRQRDHPFGALVVTPLRHLFAWVQLDDAASLGAVGPLVTLAHDTHRDGPGSITDALHWVHGGVWTRVATRRSLTGQVSVEPPQSLVATMNRLVAKPN
jgi:hypothetical protein